MPMHLTSPRPLACFKVRIVSSPPIDDRELSRSNFAGKSVFVPNVAGPGRANSPAGFPETGTQRIEIPPFLAELRRFASST